MEMKYADEAVRATPICQASPSFLFLFSSYHEKRFASIVPEILWYAQLTAHGTTQIIASGCTASISSLAKNAVARTVAMPAFCIPTSIERVRRFAVLNLHHLPTL